MEGIGNLLLEKGAITEGAIHTKEAWASPPCAQASYGLCSPGNLCS
jgi:hypothetical protein